MATTTALLAAETAQALSTRVELRLACVGLPSIDVVSPSDPFVIVYERIGVRQWQQHHAYSFSSLSSSKSDFNTSWARSARPGHPLVVPDGWREIGRTEVVWNNNNPRFTQRVLLEYRFEEVQDLEFHVYDCDTPAIFNIIGIVRCCVSDMVRTQTATIKRAIINVSPIGYLLGATNRGELVITCEPLHNDPYLLSFRPTGIDLAQLYWTTYTKPYLQVFKTDVKGNATLVYSTPVVHTRGDAVWPPVSISLRDLCNGDFSREIRFRCMSWVDESQSDQIGGFSTTLEHLTKSSDPEAASASASGTPVSPEPLATQRTTPAGNTNTALFVLQRDGFSLQSVSFFSISCVFMPEQQCRPSCNLTNFLVFSVHRPTLVLCTSLGLSRAIFHAQLWSSFMDPPSTSRGLLRIDDVRIERQYSLLEFIRGGMQIGVMMAIDFTASNGMAISPQSLHYYGGTQPNPYEKAIQAIGTVVAPYDADQLFPIWGFGAVIDNEVNFCFSLTAQIGGAHGVDGLLQAYKDTVRTAQFRGPTYFAPVIRAASEQAASVSSPDVQQYSILLIITDGCINDQDATIDAIIDASSLPLSIIIVGVGNADFSSMVELDGDDGLLRRAGRTAKRDIVQFVPFNKFAHNPMLLASETLAEVPQQVSDWARLAGAKPLRVANLGGQPQETIAPGASAAATVGQTTKIHVEPAPTTQPVPSAPVDGEQMEPGAPQERQQPEMSQSTHGSTEDRSASAVECESNTD